MKTTELKVPALRFSEFEGEWEVKELGEITKINQGLQIPIADRLTIQAENSYFYITNEFLKEGSIKKYFIAAPSKNVLCNEDDVLMTRTGNTGQVVTGVAGAFHNNFFKIVFDRKKYNKSFFVYFLNLGNTQKQIIRYAGTSTIPDLNHSDFYRLLFNFPSFDEQKKIADFLSATDMRLELLKEKKQGLEDYKRGAMQRIFSQKLRFIRADGSAYEDWEEKKLGETLIKYQLGGNYSNNLTLSKHPLIKMGNIDRGTIKLSKVEYIEDGENIDETHKLKYGDLLFNTRNTLDLVGKVAIWKDELQVAYYNSNLLRLDFANNFFMNYYFNSVKGLQELKRLATGTTSVAAIYTSDLLTIRYFSPCLEEQTQIANFLSAIDVKIEKLSEQIEATENYKKGLLQQMFV